MTTFEYFAAMIPPEIPLKNGVVLISGRASFRDITCS